MKHYRLIFLSFAALVLGAATEVTGKTWHSSMTELSAAMNDIIPDILVPDADQKDEVLKKKIKRIYDISKDIDQSGHFAVKAPDRDPTLPYISKLFREDIERAYKSFQDGNRQYAKNLLRSSALYCVACHTRSQNGPQFPLQAAFTKELWRVSWIERLTFQAATRQFDAAYSEVMGQLKSGGVIDAKPFELERGVRLAMAIAVRVQRDPNRGLLLARAVDESRLAPQRLKESTRAWTVDLNKWRDEKKSDANSAEKLMEKARSLVGAKTDLSESIWAAGEEIKFLRASALMHDLLKSYPDSPYTAEALYLIGLSYDVLQDLGIWSLHEMYYQACIEKQPNSKLAQRCYERYNESVILGYSGSSGIRVPESVKSHLARLKKLADPKVSNPKMPVKNKKDKQDDKIQ